MKVLILTYYWPPAGGSGVQRWLKFVKYLEGFGIEPIVYTIDNANYPKLDSSLENQISDDITILKQPIWEPTDLFLSRKNTTPKTTIANSTKNGFLSFIRGNFFIPDPKIFWVKPSVRYLNNYLKNNAIDVIISSGPPHSVHLIAKKLKQKHQIKWLADFRDPWTNLYYNSDFKQLNFIKKWNKNLEHSVLSAADCVLTVSNTLQKEFSSSSKRVEVVANGFDDEVFLDTTDQLDQKFTISYIGLLPKQSNPKLLFKVLQELIRENAIFKKDLQLNFIGDIADEVKQEIHTYGLVSNTNFKKYVSHKKAIEFQKKAQVLLLLIPNVQNAKGILTGKLFEYLTSKRPILAMGPRNGDLSTILKETNAGDVFSYSDKNALKNKVMDMYKAYKKDNLHSTTTNIDQFHRKQLTQKLAQIIKSL